jgi:iron complex transport system permease protein
LASVEVRRVFTVVACAVALAAAIALGTSFGSGAVTLGDLFRSGTQAQEILLGYRLPRVLLGALVGAGLAAVGGVYQTVLRNPLADPYMLGVAGGAELATAFALVVATGSAAPGALGWVAAAGVPAAAFLGALAATAIVWTIVRTGRAQGVSILLAGVVVNSISQAGTTFAEALAEPGRLQSLIFRLMGFLDAPSWGQLAFVGVYVVGGLVVLSVDAARMNLLALGDESAESLGVNVRALERRTFFACAAVVGAVVSVTGLIGFIGLVVPQAVRRIVGPDLRVALPAAAFAGGATLVTCDTLVRVLAPYLQTEIPVGALTALLGGPVFLVLLRRRGV